MINPGAVHAADHLRHLANQRTLELDRRRLLEPVEAEVFQTDGRRQLFGDDKRMLLRRIAAAGAESHGRHGRYADLGQTFDRQ